MVWARMILIEVIRVVIMIYWLCDGMYLLAKHSQFTAWVKYLPCIGSTYPVAAIIIPVGSIAVGGMVIIKRTEVPGLYLSILLTVVYISYLVLALLTTPVFFTPFHPYWVSMTWFSRMLIATAIGWLSFILLLFNRKRYKRNWAGDLPPA